MEEKDRYEFKYNEKRMKHYMFDNLTKTQLGYEDITNLLNQQSKRIKELEDMVIEYKNKLYRRLDQVDNLIKENAQLKQQLNDLPKKIVGEIKDCLLDFSNGWWRYFVTDGCEYMLSSDLQGCLDETIDTILK